MQDSLDWEDLRHFRALAGALRLDVAARTLGVTPSTVQRRVRQLEETLGAKLFVRHARGHHLTQTGRELAVEVEEVDRAVREAARKVAGRDGVRAGLVRISTTEVGAELVLLPAIPAFCAAHPALTLEIDASPRLADLSRDDEWMALRFADPVRGDHVARRLGALTFGLYAAPGAPRDRAIGWTATFAELRLARFVEDRYERLPVRLGSVRAHRQAAELGVGVAALPTFAAGAGLARVGSDALTLPVWLVVPRGIRRLARVVAAAAWVEAAFTAATGAST